MKKSYQAPEIEVTEAFMKNYIMEDQSEPEGGGWVGGNTGEFEESETAAPEPSFDQNLWDD